MAEYESCITPLLALAENSDTVTGVTFATSTAALVGHVSRTLIVVGQEDFIAVEAVAPAGVVIVGVSSENAWHDADGNPAEALNRIIDRASADSSVVIWMAGAATNAALHDEAKLLGLHFAYLGASSVKYVREGHAATILGARPDDAEERRSYLARIIDAAGGLGKRPPVGRPKKSKVPAARASTRGGSAIAPNVDMDNGTIWVAGSEGQRVVIAEFAATITATYRVFDDLKDPGANDATFMHDLEIVTVRDGRRVEHSLSAISDANLQHPRGWLNKLPGGTQVVYSVMNRTGEAIASAIRAHEPAGTIPQIDVLTRTGWHETSDGMIGFLSVSGLLTADGMCDHARSQLPKSLSMIALLDTALLERKKEIQAARNTRAMYKELTDANVFIALWGVACHAVAGLGLGAVGVLVGKPGSGKSTVAYGISAHAAKEFNPDGRGMFTVDATTANVNRAGSALHELFFIIDDARKRETARKAEAMAEGIELIVRRGYAGGFAGHAGSVQNPATGVWESGVPDLGSPAMLLIGEQLPDSEGDGLDSTKERMYPAQIELGQNIFRSGNARRYIELSTSELPQVHLAAFISWLAAQMSGDTDGRAGWTARWEAVRRSAEDARADIPVSTRVRKVSVVPQIGMNVWLAYLLAIGAIDEQEYEDDLAEIEVLTRKTALTHGTENVTTSGFEWESIMNSLRASYASGLAVIIRAKRGGNAGDHVDPDFQLTQKLLGFEKVGRGDTPTYLAMQPRDVLAILRTESKYRGLTEKDLIAKFAPVALTDPGKKHKIAVFGGVRTQTLSIPMALFENERADAISQSATDQTNPASAA
ncbi:ATP-binding protein [Cryobacterium sp. N22]|uniref:ATP-binding protein n=1 Tax=Cryobacterium sp. N22 TaxID=2048290 RepID=UPI0011B03B5F|nr:ATP-binding protein [Cryobacterium sp. N22]